MLELRRELGDRFEHFQSLDSFLGSEAWEEYSSGCLSAYLPACLSLSLSLPPPHPHPPQVRPRLSSDPVFDTITEESERVRLFKDYIKSLKV